MELKQITRALKYGNFRLFFYGQCISLTGTWMQSIAISWLVYRLTNSPFLLGVVGFTGQIATFMLSPFFGVLVDRWNRRRIILITQTLAMFQAGILAMLVITGKAHVWHIIVLSLLLGLINAFDMPSRQAFIVEIVDKRKEDLANAIALNSLSFNGARLVGPVIAGFIIARAGEGICFLINSLSYLAIIIALMLMKVKSPEANHSKVRILRELKEGFTYTFGFKPIRNVLGLFAGVNLTGISCVVLMPIFAKEVFKGGARTLGFLMGAIGFGALLGSLYVAYKDDILAIEKRLPMAVRLFGLALILFSFSRILWLSLLFLSLAGFSLMIYISSSNMLLQHFTDDDKRGRVMSIYTMAFLGMATFGSLWVGFLASKLGAPWTLFISGVFCILAVFFFKK